MSSYTSGVANSIVASKSITVSATDVSDGFVEVDFEIDEVGTGFVQVVDASNVNVPLDDAVITQPSNGVIRITNGGATFALVADQVVKFLFVRDKV